MRYKKLFIIFVMFLFMERICSQINIGVISAVRSKVRQLKEKKDKDVEKPQIINNPPTLSWTGETSYTTDGLHPEEGDTSTTFVYRIKYTDTDNDPPAEGYPKVHIKKAGVEIERSPFTMTFYSGEYKTGVIYTYSTKLSSGTDYTYYFEAIDSKGASAKPTEEIDAPDVSYAVNFAPRLVWTEEQNYESDGLHPETGDTRTIFVYRIRYIHEDNDPPMSGYPRVHIKKGGVEIFGSPFTMNYVSGTDYKTGVIYEYYRALSEGTDYTYYFDAQDSKDAYVATSEINAPSVSYVEPFLWKFVSSGYNHTVAIRSDDTLWSWGDNSFGQLGLGDNTNRLMPTQVGTDTWKFVSAGWYYTVAIKSDGTLWSWGYNGSGQLGLGDTVNRSTPTQVGNDTDWEFVSAGRYHTVAIKNNGTLWSWGSNSSGQLGLKDYTNRLIPTQVGTDTWETVSAGATHTVAIKSDGTLWSWGYNGYGQLGLGDTVSRSTPTQVGTETSWVVVSAGEEHTVAKKSDGTLWSWGRNSLGQLGLGDTANRLTPTQVGTDTNWIFISAGGKHTVAIKSDNTLWSWGWNGHGQLGLGDNANRLTPFQVGTNWMFVSAGYSHTMGIKTDDTLWSCGDNRYGQLGVGDTIERITPSPLP